MQKTKNNIILVPKITYLVVGVLWQWKFWFWKRKTNLDFQIRFPLVWSNRKENEKEKRWGEWEIEEPRLKVHFLSSSSDLSKSNYSTRQRRDGKERISNYKEGVKEMGRNFHFSFFPSSSSFSKRSRSCQLFSERCVSYTQKRKEKSPCSFPFYFGGPRRLNRKCFLSVVCFFWGGLICGIFLGFLFRRPLSFRSGAGRRRGFERYFKRFSRGREIWQRRPGEENFPLFF